MLCNLLGVLWRKAQMIRIIAALMILNASALAESVPSVQFLEDSATQTPIILDPLPLADIVSYRYVPRILVIASGLEAGEALSLRMDDQEVASGTADAGGNVALRASLWRLIQISGQYTLFLYEAGESGFVCCCFQRIAILRPSS